MSNPKRMKTLRLIVSVYICILCVPLLYAGDIQGLVWGDLNADAVFDGNEIPEAGLLVTLESDAGGSFVSVDTTMTDASGAYAFSGIAAGDYRINITPPEDMVFVFGSDVDATGIGSPFTLGATDTVMAGGGVAYAGACPPLDTFETTHAILISMGMSSNNIVTNGPGILGGERDVTFNSSPVNSGIFPHGNIADADRWILASAVGGVIDTCTTWDGVDGDPVALDPTGLGGMDFTAGPTPYQSNDSFQFNVLDIDEPTRIILRAYTDAGNWSEYVQIIPDEAVGMQTIPFSSFMPQAGGGADFTSIGAYQMCVESMESNLDFEIRSPLVKAPTLAALGNRVWEDINNDGQQDPGEVGISNVTVNLYESGSPSTPVATTTTGANGEYIFNNLVPGNYFVEFMPPAGSVLTTQDATGIDDAEDSDADLSNGRTEVTTLDPGEVDLTWDAGIYYPAEVGDIVWFDVNRNGVQDVGELGVPNVTVELFEMVNGAPVSRGTMNTDPNGRYLFSNLSPGDYYVEFSPPTTFRVSPIDNGTEDFTDSDIDSNGETVVFNIESGDSDLTRDAGIYKLVPGYALSKIQVAPGRVAEVGETVSFNIVIENTGEVPLVTVPLSDTYDPAFLQFVSAAPVPSTSTAGNLTWGNLGTLAVGEAHSVTVEFMALQSSLGAEMENTATTAPTTPAGEDPVPSDKDTAPYEIAAPAYTITKTRTAPATPEAEVGETVTFDITIENTGEVVLQTVPVTDTFDDSLLQFDSASPVAPTVDAGTLTWGDIGSIAVGSERTVTVNFIALASTMGQTEMNVASTTPSTPNQTLPEMEDEAPYLLEEPSYTLVKDRTSPLTAEVGETVTFTITVANDGEVELLTVPLVDMYDASLLEFVSATPTSPTTAIAGALAWDNIGAIMVGGSRTITLTFTALASTDGNEELNTASTTPSTANQQLDMMEDTAPYRVLEPDYTITKTRSTSQTAELGDTVSFDIVIENTGETALATVPLDDTYDAASLRFISASMPPDTMSTGSLSWANLGALSVGASHTVTVNFEAIASTAGNLRLNTAETTPTTPAGMTLPTMDDDDNYRVLVPAYTITKTRTTPQQVEVGESVNFRIVIENTGETGLATVPVTDIYDASLIEFRLASPTQTSASPGTLSWANVGPIPVGGSESIDVMFTALASTVGELELNVARTEPVTDGGNTLPPMSDDDDYLVLQPDYTITKERIAPANPEVEVGGIVTFRITVENTGEVPLMTVPLEDSFDASLLAFASASMEPNSSSPGSLSWNDIGSIALGASQSVDVDFTALASTAGALDTNVVTTTPTTATGPLPPKSDDDVFLVQQPGFSMTKTRTSAAVAQVGETITYDIVIENTGEVSLISVPVSDQFDADVLAFDSATPNPSTAADGELTWNNIGAIVPGDSSTITVSFTAIAYSEETTNLAITQPSTPFGPLAEEMDGDIVEVAADPALSLEKTVLRGHDGASCETAVNGVNERVTGVSGDPVTYCFRVINEGNVHLTNIALSDDTLGLSSTADFTLLSGTAPLAPGASMIYFVESTITATLTNTARVVADPAAPDGTPIAGLAPLDDADTAAVELNDVSLGNYVWIDENFNGQQDADEPGLGGVTVHLLNAAGTPTGDMTLTDDDGFYLFDNLPPGVYGVDFDPPAEYVFTIQDTGDDSSDSDANASGTVVPTALPNGGDEDLTLDAGVYAPASLGDFVWEDTNNNGQQDPGEPGIEGVTVTLTGPSGTVTTTTDENGAYEFTDLPPGTYTVTFTPPEGYEPTLANTGDDASDSDGTTTTVSLGSGDEDPTIDSGFYQPAGLGDTVWLDANMNGQQDPDEPGIEGVTVTLTDAAGTTTNTTMTDADGAYEFTGLPPGTYTVTFTAPDIYDPTVVDMGDDASDSDGLSVTTTLESGEFDPTLDSGFYTPTSLGDFVWEDLNLNGQQDPGEPGIEGVTVTLTDENGDELGTTTTDSNGAYNFPDLAPGSYTVTFTTPDGYMPTLANTGDDTSDSDGLSTSTTLASGDRDPTLDSGFYQPASLGDLVWEDLNLNGQQDPGEPGIEGVTVTLTDGNGDELGTTTTDANGAYNFPNLMPGSYTVTFTTPDGYMPTLTNAVDGAADSDGLSASTTLGSGDRDPTLDSGFYQPASLGDLVWEDLNLNGQQDPGEPGIEGVTVTLESPSGMFITLTDTNGAYQFTDLPPGDYTISFLPPEGYQPTVTNSGDAASDSDGATVPVSLQSGEDDPTLDSGFFRLASLGDFVWVDLNGNGLTDEGEPGVSNVLVEAFDANGDSVGTTFTDSTGFYEFTGLMPGAYSVVFTLPEDALATLENAGPVDLDSGTVLTVLTNGTSTVVQTTDESGLIPSGTHNPNLDQGIVYPKCIHSTVFIDLTRDNMVNEATPRYAGIPVTLTLPDGSMIEAITDDEGGVSFEGLMPGDYTIAVDTNAILSQLPAMATIEFTDMMVMTMFTVTSPLGPDEDCMEMNFGFTFIPPTAIELISFEATVQADGVLVEWATAAELGTLGFNVYGVTEDGMVKINDSFILAGEGAYALLDPTGYTEYILEEVETSLNASLFGPAIVQGGFSVVDAVDGEDVLVNGSAVATLAVDGGLLVYLDTPGAELTALTVEAPIRMASASGINGDIAFVAPAEAMVFDVSNPSMPVLLIGEELDAPGAPAAVYYAVNADTAIAVYE